MHVIEHTAEATGFAGPSLEMLQLLNLIVRMLTSFLPMDQNAVWANTETSDGIHYT